MMSSFDLCQVLMPPNFAYELSLEIQKYRLQCVRIYEISVRIYEIMGKFWADIAYGVWSAAAFLDICVLKLWEAAPSLLWMRTHRRRVFICPAAGGGYIVFLVLLKQQLDAFQTVQHRQNSIKIHLKPFKIDKNSFQTDQKSTFVATRVMWAAHESCFLFILAAEIFLELEFDKRGILWYNISIMGSLCSFVAAPLRLLLLLRPYRYPGWVWAHVKFMPSIF